MQKKISMFFGKMRLQTEAWYDYPGGLCQHMMKTDADTHSPGIPMEELGEALKELKGIATL